MDLVYLPLLSGVLSVITVIYLIRKILNEPTGSREMVEIASYIEEGAKTFLDREFKTIVFFIIPITALLDIFLSWEIAFGFVAGSLSSLLAAYIGMRIAVKANLRTAYATVAKPKKAVVIAFRGGAVTGLSVIGLSLMGLSLLYLLFREPVLLVGYGFGASLSALFTQLGGGIFTKAADVGADLVGKVEARIPEDDPRNPAVIADAVGDNVGDCAGRGADLFESFSDNIIGAMILGLAFATVYGTNGVVYPLTVESTSIFATILGVLFIRESMNPTKSIYQSFLISGVISLIGFYLASTLILHDITLFYCSALGLTVSLIIAVVVLYYTKTGGKITKAIANASKSGPALTILTGLSYGFESAAVPILVVAFTMSASYLLANGGMHGIFGISASTLGILSSTGIIMASDTFGPIVDNAQGISKMSGVSADTEIAEMLDSVGNVTKAVTKGYAMACCVFTAVLILFAYITEAARIQGIPLSFDNIILNIAKPINLTALFIGASLPFIFSALSIRAVNKAALHMVEEVRRQFRERPGILKGTEKPDYNKCIDISTRYALKEMFLPTLVALIFPIAVGFLFSIWALAIYLIAVKVVSGLLAMFMYNSGGAWDNAKKLIELGYIRNPDAHVASVIGDTVGDPLKDCAGPSLHILVKLQNILAITLLPLFFLFSLS